MKGVEQSVASAAILSSSNRRIHYFFNPAGYDTIRYCLFFPAHLLSALFKSLKRDLVEFFFVGFGLLLLPLELPHFGLQVLNPFICLSKGLGVLFQLRKADEFLFQSGHLRPQLWQLVGLSLLLLFQLLHLPK